jgi:hypothetical protein
VVKWPKEEEFEDTKGAIKIRISKNRQLNGQKKKHKRTNNYLQITTQKTKDRTTQIQLKTLKTEILKPVSVSLTVKSFEKPVVLWMKSSGGKLSTWFVRETHNQGKRLYNTYLVTSTIIPLKHIDFGSYSVRIRNSEGTTAVSLYLMYEGMLWYFLSNL